MSQKLGFSAVAFGAALALTAIGVHECSLVRKDTADVPKTPFVIPAADLPGPAQQWVPAPPAATAPPASAPAPVAVPPRRFAPAVQRAPRRVIIDDGFF